MIQAMKNAFTNLLKEPYTCDYPASPIHKPKNYRGLIEFNGDHCIWCDKCEKVCPPNAIIFKQYEDGQKVYNYNPYLCIYCGDCVRACPKAEAALWQSEKKGLPARGASAVNDKWFAWEKEAKESRENYKILKEEQKKLKKI